MSTIPSASPRPSLSSARTSIDTTTAPTSDRTTARRTKAAALRDYYNLPSTTPAPSPPRPSFEAEHESSQLDNPNFDPSTYVFDLLKRDNLHEVLRVEAGLLSEIRTLDGEKKALVYDNYSKLISATETIRKMRERMEPLSPTTKALMPAVGHIAETASALEKDLKREERGGIGEGRKGQGTVRWVWGAPERLKQMREDGKAEEAEKEWKEIEGLLSRWDSKGVRGVEEVRKRGRKAMRSESVELGG